MISTVHQTPPGYLGVLFLLWGFTIERPVLGLVLAAIAEGNILVKHKWELTRDDFVRISDISSLVMLAALGIIYFTHERWQVMRQFVVWLPVIHLPLLIAQRYSTADRIIIGTRLGRRKGKDPYTHRPFNITWVYAVIILFAAAAANNRAVWFFPATFLVGAWGLFTCRGRRYRTVAWVAAVSAVLFLSSLGAIALNRAYLYVQDRMIAYYSLWLTRLYADPFKASTAIGDVTALKPSGRILLRVVPEFGQNAPFYLVDGIYDTYTATSWYNREKKSRLIPIEENNSWRLYDPPKHEMAALSVTAWLPRRKGVIALPRGTHTIGNLNVGGLAETSHGAVFVEEGPELIQYTAFYQPGISFGDPPGPRDLAVPPEEEAALDATLEMIGAFPDAVSLAAAIERHFFFSFRYALFGAKEGTSRSPVAEFLLTTRKGHCEYFATAMVLLLRRVGVPARYVTGFVVDEWNPFEEAYVVRERHGHAWVTAWIGEQWVDFDPTPPGWLTEEALAAGWFERIGDFFNYLRLRYEQIRRVKNEKLNRAFVAVVALLAAWLTYRIYARRKRRVEKWPAPSVQRFVPRQGIDSPFFAVVPILAAYGIERFPHESLRAWITRLRAIHYSRGETPQPLFDSVLDDLLALHERYRFDPRGLGTDDRQHLFAGTAVWIERYRQLLPRHSGG